MLRRTSIVVAIACAWLVVPSVASAAVIVVANLGDTPVAFELSHPVSTKNVVVKVELPARTTRPLAVGREPEIGFLLNGKPTRYRLDPYASYYFAEVDGKQVFSGIELIGPMPKVDDVPVDPPIRTLWKLPVEIVLEDTDPRRPEAALKDLAARVQDASTILERQLGVSLDVVGTGVWAHDPEVDEFSGTLRRLERAVKPKPGVLTIGFSSYKAKPKLGPDGKPDPKVAEPVPFSASRGPFAKHLLIRESGLRTEADKLEVLVHELGRRFGAVNTPDSRSAMRKKLGDGQAVSNKFPIQFDPLNAVVVNIWAEQFRMGQVKSFADVPKHDRERLTLLYKSLVQLGADDPNAVTFALNLEDQEGTVILPPTVEPAKPEPRPEVPKAVVPEPRPKSVVVPEMPKVVVPKPKPELPKPMIPKVEPLPPVAISPRPVDDPNRNAKQNAVRTVVAAVRTKAVMLKASAAAERPKGDALTAEYVRAAAASALQLEAPVQVHGFLVGLGIALDDGTTLADNLLTGESVKSAETEAQRKERIAALGVPTVRSRADLNKHFTISAALTALLGPGPAEAAGLAKEMLDLQGNSGFSFHDLAADLAGIEFAKGLKEKPEGLKELATSFEVEAVMPLLTGLREGLSPKRFAADYGAIDDARFTAALADIRKRIRELK